MEGIRVNILASRWIVQPSINKEKEITEIYII